MTTLAPRLDGLRVAAFESRRADELAQLVARLGGQPAVSPSMREVPLGQNPAAVAFARALVAGEFDLVLLMTGVGVRHLLAEVEGQVPRAALLDGLRRTITVARGPKPVAVLRELGLSPSVRVPEPNTWRDILATLDLWGSVAGKRIGVQEYGIPNPELTKGLEVRGATVSTVQVYRWELPLDLAPLEDNVRAIAAGQRDAALFTSSQQVIHLLHVAQRLGLEPELRRQMARLVVASIGPTTSETLREQRLPVDVEPEHGKLGHLVLALAEQGPARLAAKRGTSALPGNASPSNAFPGNSALPNMSPAAVDRTAADAASPRPAWHDSPFLKACRREPVPYTPIWLMRQAGRYLPEYRAIRGQTTFLGLCKNSDLSAEVMIRTVERLGVDAAIIFSDLLPILEPMGLELEFAEGEGPIIHNPIRQAGDLERFRELEALEPLEFVFDTVRKTRRGLAEKIPVIGFAGAPFTLASYAIEGGGSRNYLHAKSLMYRDPGAWHELMRRLVRAITRYLNAQIDSGAQAVQLFDSWVGCLGPEDYRQYVLPHTQAVIAGIRPGTPVINFATGNPALLPLLASAGGDVIGVDWRIGLAEAWRQIGHHKAVQGNLDPLVLLAEPDEIRRRAVALLDEVAARPGHIFNLGHGVLPQTSPDHVLRLIETVHQYQLPPPPAAG